MSRVLVLLSGLALAAAVAACTGNQAGPVDSTAMLNTAASTGAGIPAAVALHDGKSASASRLCTAARIGRVATASATTVGGIRSIKGGHTIYAPQRLLPRAMSPAPSSARDAWCWITIGPSDYAAYVVTDGLPPQMIGTVHGPGHAPVGEYPLR